MEKKKITVFCVLLFFFPLAALSYSKQRVTSTSPNVLENIFISKQEKTLDVRIFLNYFTFPRLSKMLSPNRLVMDFFNVTRINAAKVYNANYAGVLTIRTAMHGPRTARVVFDMAGEIPPYRMERLPNGWRIIFGVEEEIQRIIPQIVRIEDAVCGLQVAPAQANINDPISVDMSSSQHATSMEVEVFSPEGIKIESKKLSPDSPQWKTIFDKSGEYVFKGKAFNAQGKPSENPCEAKAYINSPPLSKLECKPCEDYVGKPLTLDASGSEDPDGEVVKVDFTIIDEAGNLVDRFTNSAQPFTWGKLFDKEGLYTVIALATDDFGAISEPSRVSVTIKTKKAKRFSFLIDAGALAARGGGTWMGYAAGRVGLIYRIVPEKLDFSFSAGGGYVSNVATWKSYFALDALFTYHLGPAFIGLGGGATTTHKDSIDFSYGEGVANLGFDVFKKSKMTGSVFLEFRVPANGLSIEENYKLMLGFRLVF